MHASKSANAAFICFSFRIQVHCSTPHQKDYSDWDSVKKYIAVHLRIFTLKTDINFSANSLLVQELRQ